MIFVPSEGGVSTGRRSLLPGRTASAGPGCCWGFCLRRQAFQIRLTDKGDCYGKIRRIFKLKERGTSVKIEVLAGITTFMTMAYVLVVQPGAIIGFGDAVSFTDINGLVITKEAIAVTCAVISALITLLMALLPTCLCAGNGYGNEFHVRRLLQSNTCPLAPSWP